MSQHAIELGDVVEVLKSYKDNSFDGVVCDPPYAINFMGKKWDCEVPSAELWAEVLRVCKPGAALIAFGGTRTYHRLVCAIEDAGWEIRDQLAWMYGSGFPKSLDVSKALDSAAGAVREVVGSRKSQGGRTTSPNPMDRDRGEETGDNISITAPSTDAARQWAGYGTALKPAFEPAVLARKPLEGTVAANVAKWGVGALAIDASRVGTEDKISGGAGRASFGPYQGADYVQSTQGRWPANVILDEEAGEALDVQTGNRPGMSGGGKHKAGYAGGMFGGIDGNEAHARNDSGGASRFFKRIECDSASIVKSLSPLPNLLDAFAQSVAAISARPEGLAKTPSSCLELFTDVTQLGSALNGARSTESILSIGERFLLASKHTSTLLIDLVRYAGPTEQTDITRIMESLEKCTSCVEHAISLCTSRSSEAGARDFARFSYCAKANRKERDLGCEDLPLKSGAEMTDSEEGQARLDSPRTGAGRTGGARNHHPTVKPIALMEYLARLIMPPNPGAILVPFSGSGSEMIGALKAGWPAVLGIERESEYVEIARARLKARVA